MAAAPVAPEAAIEHALLQPRLRRSANERLRSALYHWVRTKPK